MADLHETSTRKRGDLRKRFGVVLALALLPLLAFSIWQSRHDYQRDTRFRQIALDEAAETAVSAIIETLDTAKSVLRLASELIRPETCQVDMGRVMRDFPKIYNMAVYWPEDETLCQVREIRSELPLDGALQNLTPEEPYKLEVLQFDAQAQGPKRTLIVAYGNFNPDKSLRNIIFSAYDLSTLRNLKNRGILPDDVRVSIFARNGQILVGEDGSTVNMRTSWASLLDTQDRVVMNLPIADDEDRRLTLLPTREKELFLAVSAPQQSLMSWQRFNPWAGALVPILGWVFGTLAIWLALESLVLSRLRFIRRDIQAFARDKTLPNARNRKTGNDAIGALADSVENMAQRIVDREQDLTRSLEDKEAILLEKETILREVHHRVKNNLQIIISLLNMSRRQVKDPFYTQAIDDTRNRIVAISQVHKTLHESDALSSVDLEPFMVELCKRLSRALALSDRGVSLAVHVDADAVDADTATPIALFVVEALTNAAKHGLPNGGTISVTLVEANGELNLSVQDNGIGATAAAQRDAQTPELSTGTGTGQRLMKGFARQLGGHYQSETSARGYLCRLSFPRRDVPSRLQPAGR